MALTQVNKVLTTGPSFKAYKSTAQDSNTANGADKVTFKIEVWDNESC